MHTGQVEMPTYKILQFLKWNIISTFSFVNRSLSNIYTYILDVICQISSNVRSSPDNYFIVLTYGRSLNPIRHFGIPPYLELTN